MRNQRRRSALNKGVHGRSNSNKTVITDLPYELLIFILSLFPIKDAVVTSSVCKNWRFLWCGLTHLNFDSSERLFKINKRMYGVYPERIKYIKQVDSVIKTYNHPVVHRFRISFDLRCLNQSFIDDCLKFAVSKNVEILELDMENSVKVRNYLGNYEFARTLSMRNEGQNSHDMVVELGSLKKLYLNNVSVRDAVLDEILTRALQLESITIHGSRYLTQIRVGGRHLKLKHFEIKECFDLQSVYLSDFDLLSFTYTGPPKNLCFSNLSKLIAVNICQGACGLANNVFSQISCVSSLQALSFSVHHPKKTAKFDSIPELPNVKKLTLIIGAHEDDCLLEYASIAKVCPKLETFIIELLWFSPIRRRRKVRHVASTDHLGNLKLFKILGYYGRISDLELAAYVIDRAVELKKVVIDPRCHNPYVISTEKDLLKKENAARAFALRQLNSMVPLKSPCVNLVIL